MSLTTYLDKTVARFYDREDLPEYVDADKFFAHQREALLDYLKMQKEQGSNGKRVSVGPFFLMPLVSGDVDLGASDIMNFVEDKTNDDFFVSVPKDIWSQIGEPESADVPVKQDMIETASVKMFDWFIADSGMTKLFENANVRKSVWDICAPQIRQIFQDGLDVGIDDSEDEDEEDEALIAVSNRFYPVVDKLIWNNVEYHDDLHGTFEELLREIK